MTPEAPRWNCADCHASFVEEEKTITTIFRVTVKGTYYEVENDPARNKTIIYRFSKTSPSSPILEPYYTCDTILESEPIWQNITPENVKDKLKTILIFS